MPLSPFGKEFELLLGHSGLSQRDLAKKIATSESNITALKKKAPKREMVLGIADACNATVSEYNRLLRAAKLADLDEAEMAQRGLHPSRVKRQLASEPLESAEAWLIEDFVRMDVSALFEARDEFKRLRAMLSDRNWDAVLEHFAESGASLRFGDAAGRWGALRQLLLAGALHNSGQFAQAKAAVLQGLARTTDRAVRGLLYIRLADIEKSMGLYADSEAHYDGATESLRSWRGASTDQGHQFLERRTARIQRRKGNLFLFEGRLEEAEVLLRESMEFFTAHGPRYERRATHRSYGWLNAMLGNWDDAKANYEAAAADGRDFVDDFIGCVDLAGFHLLREDLTQAQQKLTQAENLRTRHAQLKLLHESGRVDLLSARLEAASGCPRRTQAEHAAERGLNFYLDPRRLDPHRVAMALNASGDVQMQLGHVEKALEVYEQACSWAASTMPAAAYVETAALVNVARARIRAGHDPRRVKQAIGDAEDACRLHKFWQHLVVLRTAEVEQYRVGIGAESQADACYGALWAACHTHRRLLSSTVQRLSTSLAAHSDVNTAIAHVRSLLQRVMQEFDPKTWTPDPLLAMVAEDLCQRPQSKPLDSSAA